MVETQRGFVLVDTPQSFGEIGQNRIARILHKPPQYVSQSEIVRFAHALIDIKLRKIPEIGQLEFSRLRKKYDFESSGDPREIKENVQAFYQAVQLIDGNDAISNSYGIYEPSYKKVLKKQKETWGNNKYNSLLIGALTSETALEYTATVKDTFPQANTYIVDIEGRETTKSPGFIFASGLELPFPDESISSIHTNYLLHMIEGESASGKIKLQKLLSESWRTLSPNGQLVMCEGKLDTILDSPINFLRMRELKKLLKQQGFVDISIGPAEAFSNRQEMTRHFRSTHGANNEIIVKHPRAIFITATKK